MSSFDDSDDDDFLPRKRARLDSDDSESEDEIEKPSGSSRPIDSTSEVIMKG